MIPQKKGLNNAHANYTIYTSRYPALRVGEATKSNEDYLVNYFSVKVVYANSGNQERKK